MTRAPEYRGRLNKRPPEFVPPQYRGWLDQYSKADLMEMVWSFAMRLGGEDNSETALGLVAAEHAAIRGRGRLTRGEPE